MLALVLAAAMRLSSVAATTPDTGAVGVVVQTLQLELDPDADRWNGSLQARLVVMRPVRVLAWTLAGPVVSRVEISDTAGRVELLHGQREPGRLLVEARRPLARGPAALAIAFDGTVGPGPAGMVRTGPGHVELARAAGAAFPAWPPGTSPSRWRVVVHAPEDCTVRCPLPPAGMTRQGAWRTWAFASRAPLPADSLRLEVRRAPPAPR
jgi:hypothetical protein